MLLLLFAKGVQPLVSAIIAEMVSAKQPLGDFHSAVVCPIAQVVVWLGANRAVALIFRNVLNLDVSAGYEEGQGGRLWCQQVCILIISQGFLLG